MAASSMVLSSEELAELTGMKTHPAQIRVLEHMGIPYRPRPGRLGPAVLRIHVETPAAPPATIKRRPQVQP